MRAFALTEANAGSDASKGAPRLRCWRATTMCSTAPRCFITTGLCGRRDGGVRHDRSQRRGTRGISAFIVERQLPRLLCGQARGEDRPARLPHRLSWCSPTASCPKENLLGKEGPGLQDRHDRRWTAAASASLPRPGHRGGAVEEAINYTKEPRAVRQNPISLFQNTQFTFADMKGWPLRRAVC